MKSLFSLIACSLFSTLAASSCLANKEEPVKPVENHCEKAAGCCKVSYAFDASFFFVQPNGSNLYFGAEAVPLDSGIAVPSASPNWNTLEINPSYHFGFGLGLAALCPEACMFLSLDWQQLRSSDSKSFEVGLSTDMVGPVSDIGPNSINYKTAKGKVAFNFDTVNFLVGKRVGLCGGSAVNFFTGLAFGYIKQYHKATFSSVDQTIQRVVKTPSTFAGIGPEVGFNLDYRFCGNFSFVTKSSLALIMGRMKNKTTYESYTPELATLGIEEPNVQKTTVPKRWQLVPGLEERLAFGYETAYRCFRFSFEAGYLAAIYLNAIQSMDMTAPQVLPSLAPFTPDVGVFAVGFERTLSDFILTGPYLTVGLDF